MPNTSFSAMTNNQNQFSRRWGTRNSKVEPFISGYFFIHFSYLPEQLPTTVGHAGDKAGLGTLQEIASTLHSSCLSVNIPGATVNTTDIIGLGGVKWSVPTNVEWDNTATLKFLEISSLPIHTIMHGWVRMIRDYRSGVTTLDSSSDYETYNKQEYGSTMYYWITRPDGHLVEYAACLTGMFPKKDPTDLLSSDITTNDKLEIDIDFNVDYLWHEQWVMDNAQELATTYHDTAWTSFDSTQTIQTYGASEDSQEAIGNR